jgi:hypothetical protein
VGRSGDATVVIGKQREQLGGRTTGERSSNKLDESPIADTLESGGQAALELVLALREGGGIEGVLGHVTDQCNVGPECHLGLGGSVTRLLATRLLGYSAARLLGYSATRLLGYSAARLLGCSAARLLGCSAARLLRMTRWLFDALADSPASDLPQDHAYAILRENRLLGCSAAELFGNRLLARRARGASG